VRALSSTPPAAYGHGVRPQPGMPEPPEPPRAPARRRRRRGARLLLASLSALLTASAPAAAGVLRLPAGHRSTEAHVAVDPTDPNDVLVVARDEERGRRVGLRMWRSHDGGRSFRGGMLVDRRLEGAPADASDPVALFDHRGQPAPAFLALRYGQSTWETRIMLGDRVVVRAVYGPPFPTLGEGFGTRTWYDKPWAAIDPRDGLAHVTWTENGSTATGPLQSVAVASAPPGAGFPAAHVLGAGSGAQPVLGRGSTVLVVWYRQPNLSQRARILSSRSLDRGRTWSAPAVVARRVNSPGDPPFPTVARTSAGFTACWQQYTTRRREQIACARSRDGIAWSRPALVGRGRGGGDAAQPALAAGPHGTLWLAFYRFGRRSTSVELWSARGGDSRWRFRSVLMRRRVPRSGSYFLGDYEGLATSRKAVVAAFTMPVRNHGFRQVVEVAQVRP
jgi:hypothetical protein